MTNIRHKISYCVKCGLVNLTGKEHECNFCKNTMQITDEFFDEICSTNDFSDKLEIEEYVRQNHVYFDDDYDETLMEQRENNSSVINNAEYYENKFLSNESSAKCPTCNSSNIKKISTTNKVVGGIAFGLFCSNVRKTMRCNNCRYKW